MAGVSASLRAYLWQQKPREQKEQREAWVLQGTTYQGYRHYLQQAMEQGFPQSPRPLPDAIELARRPTTDASQEAAAAEPQPEQQPSSAAAAPPQYAQLHAFHGQGGSPVSVVKFAPGSADLLAWGTAGGAVHVATAEGQPRLLQVLERHGGPVADLDWSPDGSLLMSCSADGTASLWRPEAAQLRRTLRNGSGPLGCCRFHPSNPGLLLLGTAAGELLALNASTGRLMARAELQAAPMSGVGACCLEAAGPDRLLVADSRGCLHLYSTEPQGGQLAQLAWFPAPSGRFHEPASLQWVSHSPLAGGPAALLALSSGEVLHDKPWRLEVTRHMRLQQASAKVRASLRPGVAREQPELLLVGSEDCRVHVVDISRADQPPAPVASLHAHAAPVLGVAWSEDESRLASCDKRGTVVLWQRAAAAADSATIEE